MRRYDITRDDRLRTFVNAERITADSYISIAGWAFQGLRITDVSRNASRSPCRRSTPAAARRSRARRPDRAAGQQPRHPAHRGPGQPARLRQRALGPAPAHPLGQELTLTAYARGDVYHTNEFARDRGRSSIAARDGWNGRGIGALAADLRWPFVGSFRGGTQRLTPRVQLVATPPTENLDIPNEDARVGRPRGYQPVRAQPLPRLRPLGGRVARHLWRRLGVRPAQLVDRQR